MVVGVVLWKLIPPRTPDPDSELALIDFGLSMIVGEKEWLSTCCGRDESGG